MEVPTTDSTMYVRKKKSMSSESVCPFPGENQTTSLQNHTKSLFSPANFFKGKVVLQFKAPYMPIKYKL